MNSRRSRLIFLYLLAAVADIISLNRFPEFRQITKPLLMPILMVLFYLEANPPDRRTWTIVAALFFSWMGDLFLLGEGPKWFIAGLTSFLTAHLLYIRYFIQIPAQRISFLKRRPVMLIAVVVFVFELLYVLWPSLGGMRAPVLLYALVIGTMLCAALWQYGQIPDKTAVLFMSGAILFVFSDAMLAVATFKYRFAGHGTAVMATYSLAQLLLVLGALSMHTENQSISRQQAF